MLINSTSKSMGSVDFKTTLDSRLKEVVRSWNQAIENYQNVEEFLGDLNSIIQSLRNITFILQSNKGLIPDFDKWYSSKQDKMKSNPILVWVHNSRNRIVKQENLKLNSKLEVSIVNWSQITLYKTDLDPFQNISNIKPYIPPTLRSKLGKLMRAPLIKLERAWYVDTLPNIEVLYALAIAYIEIKDIVVESYLLLKLNIALPYSLGSVERHIANKYIPEPKRIIYRKLSDDLTYKKHSYPIEFDKEDISLVESRYDIKDLIKSFKEQSRNDIFSDIEFLTKFSKKILKKDKRLLPLVHFYQSNDVHGISQLIFSDKAELYMIIRSIADSLIEKDVKGLIFIQESWILNFKDVDKLDDFSDKVDRRESLDLTAIDRQGNYLRISNPFYRVDDEIFFLGEVRETDRNNANWLAPIYKVWNIK